MHRLIEEREADVPGQPRPKVATFDEVAADWLHQLQHVDAIKPSTLSDYRYMLRTPHAEPRKRGRRRAAGRVLAEFGGRAIDTITTAQVERWLERLDAQDISKRTVNKHRQVVCSVLEHAVRRPDRYGITTNVARAAPKRREPEPGVLDFYEPEEVAALARAARSGAHRDPSRPAKSASERAERRLADGQDAALFVVAAFTGLRMGELLELRWRRVSFERATLTVAASWTGGQVTVPKSRKPRTIRDPELARLAERNRFVGPDDLVFGNAYPHQPPRAGTRSARMHVECRIAHAGIG
jgi:integrase